MKNDEGARYEVHDSEELKIAHVGNVFTMPSIFFRDIQMLKPLLFAALISLSSLVQATGIGNVFGVLMGQSGVLESDNAIDNVLAKVSAQMNRNLPATVDDDTRLDSVSAVPGQHFMYHYTLVALNGSDVSTDRFETAFKPQLKKRLCDSAEMKNFLKNGVTISYLYKGKDGEPIGSAKFEPSECGYKR